MSKIEQKIVFILAARYNSLDLGLDCQWVVKVPFSRVMIYSQIVNNSMDEAFNTNEKHAKKTRTKTCDK